MNEDDFAPRVNFARATSLHVSKKKNKKKQKKYYKIIYQKKKLLTEGKG